MAVDSRFLIAGRGRSRMRPLLGRIGFAITARTLLTICAWLSAEVCAAPLEPATINRITDEAFNHGEVVDTAAYLTDHIGARLTNSPAMREAERWTQLKFREWGLKNVRAEGFDFGRGWWIEDSEVRMSAPRKLELTAMPLPWRPGTNGVISAGIVVAPLEREGDFAEWRGKLSGKIVLVSQPVPPKDATDPAFKRLTAEDIVKLDSFPMPSHDPQAERQQLEDELFARKVDAFLKSEGALALVQKSRRDGKLVHGGVSWGHRIDDAPTLPAVEMASEDYRRLVRLSKTGEVVLEIDTKVGFDDSDPLAYNILAEIPGRDPSSGYVMAGAHLDSWVAGDGAADNAAGTAIVMEAARIISSLGVKPKRTIRFALWSGEEQVYGAVLYTDRHIAIHPPQADPARAMARRHLSVPYPVQTLPGYDDLAAYFNVDNGGGKIRGIYAEGNLAAVPILQEWLQPLASMGASSVVAQSTASTDHVPMARIGLPAFQFIQDPLNYSTQVHHSNMDTFDHLRPDDLRQAAAVLASILLSAAEYPEKLPRKPIPVAPRSSKTD